ncbi:unknown [Bacteroides sp. CAG:598]|nr:unknown [Bacteroides sp. CAG:598]
MGIFHFSHGRMRRAVGSYQTVAAEVTVAWHIHSIIASISPIGTAGRVCFQNTLVHPVPDVSALQVGILVDFLPLVPQVTVGIAHRMRIFRRNDRTVRTVRTDITQPFGTGILGHVHVGIPLPLGTFVVHGTVHQIFLPFLHPQIGLVEVISVTGFITQRPEGY